MDATNERFVYRCLPITIANSLGWEIVSPNGFTATWDGGRLPEAVTSTDPSVAKGHFGEGILTFHVRCLFVTDPGWGLVATGPFNQPKDGISPLTGVVETDWSPFTFTMNWRFTRETTIKFAKGEPFCNIIPINLGALEAITPEARVIAENPILKAKFAAWDKSRTAFLAGQKVPGSDAQKEKWQKDYHLGQDKDGSKIATEHRTKLTLKAFSVCKPVS